MWPRLTRGGQSAFKKTVLTVRSESKFSSASGIGGWSPNFAMTLYSDRFPFKISHTPMYEQNRSEGH